MHNIPYFNEFINSYSDFLFNNSTINNIFNLIKEDKVKECSDIISTTSLAKYFENIDNIFFKSKYRKENYLVKQKRKRSIETSIGTVTFKRRQYININTKELYYYVDREILNIAFYQRLSNQLIAKILSAVTEQSYPKIGKMYGVSKTTVYNYVCKLREYPLDSIVYPNEPNKIDILYIQADEIRVPRQDKTKSGTTYVNTVTIHEGIEKVCKGRNKLLNKKLITRANNESQEQFNDRLLNIVYKLYEPKTVYFYGDGANWIKKCAEDISATYILDFYHAKNAINRFCTISNKEHFEPLYNLLSKNNKKEFKKYVDDNIGIDKIEKNDFRNKNYNYIINNWNSIINNYSLDKSSGCSQEGLNFHHFSRRLTTLPSGFSESNARVIAQLICCKNNNVEFENLLLETIDKINNDKVNESKKSKGYIPKQGHLNGIYKSYELRSLINATVMN